MCIIGNLALQGHVSPAIERAPSQRMATTTGRALLCSARHHAIRHGQQERLQGVREPGALEKYETN